MNDHRSDKNVSRTAEQGNMPQACPECLSRSIVHEPGCTRDYVRGDSLTSNPLGERPDKRLLETYSTVHQYVLRLEREIERLRAALEKIDQPGADLCTVTYMQRVAREALRRPADETSKAQSPLCPNTMSGQHWPNVDGVCSSCGAQVNGTDAP